MADLSRFIGMRPYNVLRLPSVGVFASRGPAEQVRATSCHLLSAYRLLSTVYGLLSSSSGTPSFDNR
jgi:hypothetical protein